MRTVLSPGLSGPIYYTRGLYSSVPNIRIILLVFGLFSISPVAILYQSLGSFTSGDAPVESFGQRRCSGCCCQS